MKTLSEKTIERLKKLAKQETWADAMKKDNDVLVVDFAGTNVDDAFEGGVDVGNTEIARLIIAELGVELN
jgi:FKBP-type peptidyl-prolyl cis-trans isomerase (trigger factor)